MDTKQRIGDRHSSSDASLRRSLIALASIAAIFALLHFVDHAIRGDLVVSGRLNPKWNHSGWLFNTYSDKPYIFPISVVVVMGLLVGGILFTVRGQLWAGYWLATGIGLGAFLFVVHFVGFSPGAAETPSVICMSYQSKVARVLAMLDLFGLFVIFPVLAVQSVKTRLRSGYW